MIAHTAAETRATRPLSCTNSGINVPGSLHRLHRLAVQQPQATAPGIRHVVGALPVVGVSAAQRRKASGVVRSSPRVEQHQAPDTADCGDPAFMQGMIEFLKEDLQHLFDDQGIDASKYDEIVEFLDPITKYNSLSGYLFNIKMLRTVFDPDYVMHDIKQTGPWEVTTRWTMLMRFTPTRWLGLSKWWSPQLLFTGVSIMGVNPETRRFNRHEDEWDAISNQAYFSVEGFQHVLSQLSQLYRTPDLESPRYTVLRKAKDYEIRRYEPFLVAQAPMLSASAKSPSGEGGRSGLGAFQALAGYIFGGNRQAEKMAMTTPVWVADDGASMQFVLPLRYDQPGQAPSPASNDVAVRREEGGLHAAAVFSGVADDVAVAEQRGKLLATLQRDRYKTDPSGWRLARYNDPSTKPPFRRNEILVPVNNFDLWDQPKASK